MLHRAMIWIADDDSAVRLSYEMVLTKADWRVRSFADGQAMLTALEGEKPALIILDIDMPRLDGWQTLAEIRRSGLTLPVLMLTNVNDVPARVRGLEAGADDYVGKPCGADELAARVRALLRRAAPTVPTDDGAWRLGEIVIDFERKRATKAGETLKLTRTDYALLALLREYGDRPVSHDVILARVWGGRAGNDHALDTHIWRLRKKLGPTSTGEPWLRNVAGVGYVLAEGK